MAADRPPGRKALPSRLNSASNFPVPSCSDGTNGGLIDAEEISDGLQIGIWGLLT